MQVADAEALDERQIQQHCNLLKLTLLPQHLLKLVLVDASSTQDKKALRETCKEFQQLLDHSFRCIKLDSGIGDNNYVVKLLRRMQHWTCFREVVVINKYRSFTWLEHLPGKLTTLTLNGRDVNLQNVAGLQCLRFLNLTCYGVVTGLQYISKLTSLYTVTSVGSVLHLAPTLKQLRTWQFAHVQDVEHLTNPEVLKVSQGVSPGFFKTHSNLAVKHLAVNASDFSAISDNLKTWGLEPTTLTRLTLYDVRSQFHTALPASITHLQLLYASGAVLEKVAAGLPGLRSLDISCTCVDELNHVTRHLTRLTSLQSLGIGMHRRYLDTHWPLCLEQVCLLFPEVAKAAQRVVKLTVYASTYAMLGVLRSEYASRKTFATHA